MDPLEQLLASQGVRSGIGGVIDAIKQMYGQHAAVTPSSLDQAVLAAQGPRAPTPSELESANAMRNSVFGEQWAAEDPRNANAMSAIERMAQMQETADPANWLGAGVIGKAGRAAKTADSMLDRMAKPELRPEDQLFGGGPQSLLPEGLQRKLRTEYPEVDPAGQWLVDKTSGKKYLGKKPTAEAELVAEARKKAQAAIDRGEYTPYFDVSKREYVDPSLYDFPVETRTQALPKKEATIQKYREMADTPETRARLETAYARGAEDPGAFRWYAMKQLFDKYVEHLGPEEGARAFKERFADAMAATTGGAAPQENWLMAHYANTRRAQGLGLPPTHQLPFPIGGRYAAGNLDMYNKIINEGRGLGLDAPKRYNFSGNFLGNVKPGTIDEQMMGLFDETGKLKAPPGDSYGAYEDVVAQLGEKRGIPTAEFQDVAWAGAKSLKEEAKAAAKGKPYKREAAKPMIQNINEILARTSMITGETQEQVLRRMIEAKGPLFNIGAGAVATGGAALSLRDYFGSEGDI